MIPFPALGGALMDAHDRIETKACDPHVTIDEQVSEVRYLLRVEHAVASAIGWSFERVGQRGCQLWGELRGDDRFAEVTS